MNSAKAEDINIIKQDLDQREEVIRRHVYEAMDHLAEPDLVDHISATYFIWSYNLTPGEVGKEICYHMTSGVRHPKEGSLLDQCTAKVVDSIAFDREERCGVVRVAFPLKMLEDENGDIFSTDILHIVGGAGMLALRENRDSKLVEVAMSDEVLAKFPGPAYGASGVRKLTNFGDRIAFGTILKPCTGITPDQEADIIYQAATNPMFLFIKEDENFLPGVPFAPVSHRARASLAAIERAREERGDIGLIFATHVSSPPHRIKEFASQALEAGVNGLMFSEYYTGGAVRMVREMTRDMDHPPAIYGHNGGISARTRHIYREVLDMFARLDGIDFRQTAPLTEGMSLLRPYGLEWRKCEEILTKPLGDKPAVMIARAGGLDQGNIIDNLIDVTKGAGVDNYLFLAGSAINGIKNSDGIPDPEIGTTAMKQALDIFQQNIFADASHTNPQSLKDYADKQGYCELSVALSQRYGI